MSISKKALKIVAASTPAMVGHVGNITATFYARMFEREPSMRRFFNANNQRTRRQPEAFAASIIGALQNLHNFENFDRELQLISHKHCALGVQPEHYEIIHDNFIGAAAEVLGEQLDADTTDAWSETMRAIASELTQREEALYSKAAWRDTRTFNVIESKLEHSHTSPVKTISLEPESGDSFTWRAGQFVTLCDNPTNEEFFAPRHYTISSHEKFQITSKLAVGRDDISPPGIMSSYIHELKVGDKVQLRAPFGVFHRGIEGQDKPTESETEVYIGGGIGITPLAAMLGEAWAEGKTNTILFHCSDSDSHPLCDTLPREKVIFGTGKTANDIDARLEKVQIDSPTARYFICGPPPFMKLIVRRLHQAHVAPERIQYEAFGPKPTMDTKEGVFD